MVLPRFNFGRNVTIEPTACYRPESQEEILQILERHRGESLRAVGSLHSWSGAPVTRGVLLELDRLNSIEIIENEDGVLVRVGPGCKIKTLVRSLQLQGWTLPSLGLIDEQTIAGATATGTHGSGKNSLSHYIEAVSIAHYDPQTGKPTISHVDSGAELLAARCSLGLMGIIVSLTLRCRARYRIEEHARSYNTLPEVLDAESEYPLQQFYLMPWSWKFFAHHRAETAKPRSWLAPLYRAYCFIVIDVGLHLVILGLARWLPSNWLLRVFYRYILPCTVVRNWHVVEESSTALTMQHELFRHIEIELFVQRSEVDEATRFLIDVINMFAGREPDCSDATRRQLESIRMWDALCALKGSYVHHYPICFRRVLNDHTLISMASPSLQSEEDWYAISLISYHRPQQRQGFLGFADFLGNVFATKFRGRCHWGKYHPGDRATYERLYPRLDEFRETIRRFDEQGQFQNEWTRPWF